MAGSSLVVVDIGGTWSRAASYTSGRLGAVRRVPTSSDDGGLFGAELAALLETVLAGQPEARGVAVSVTGPVDPATGTLYSPPNTGPGLAGFPLGTWLTEQTGLPVRIDRDTNCALLGEAAAGAARGRRNVVFATLSTGVGGAVLLDGRLLRGRDGVGGELGHLMIDPEGPACGCGRRGCLEAVASGPAIARAGGHRSGEETSAAAASGDPGAIEALAYASRALSAACVDWANAFNPELIVIGGSVARAHPEWLDDATVAVRRWALRPASQSCPVVPAELGDDAGLLGAAQLFEGSHQ